jgi:hydrogenase/urease accessory protein HupE
MRAFALALVIACASTPAAAHPPPLGIGGFPGGLLHPLFVPAHAMAIVALGLLIARQPLWTWMVTASFVVGLVGGLWTMTLGIVPAWMNELVLGGALIAALLVAADRPVPEVIGCILAVLIGFFIALDSPPETVSLMEANLMLLGTGLGAAVALMVVTRIAVRLNGRWARIGTRILASWIAASAILVLVLRLAR